MNINEWKRQRLLAPPGKGPYHSSILEEKWFSGKVPTLLIFFWRLPILPSKYSNICVFAWKLQVEIPICRVGSCNDRDIKWPRLKCKSKATKLMRHGGPTQTLMGHSQAMHKLWVLISLTYLMWICKFIDSSKPTRVCFRVTKWFPTPYCIVSFEH